MSDDDFSLRTFEFEYTRRLTRRFLVRAMTQREAKHMAALQALSDVPGAKDTGWKELVTELEGYCEVTGLPHLRCFTDHK